MKKTLLIFSILFNYILVAQTTVAEYTDFLNQEHLSPKEYILGLFEHNDIVILGEREHRETTQYDLILDIIEDERFIKNVGHVYTEVGVINRTDWANEILKSEFNTEQEFETELLKLYRMLEFMSLWEKYNMYKYLTGIYKINKDLDTNDKITIGLTDHEFDWNGMTSEKYSDFKKVLNSTFNYRDSVMADNFIKLYDKQKLKNGHKKALLIQSRPHALNLDVTYDSVRIKKTGSYIVDRYKDKVKIVAFNWYKWVPEEWWTWWPEKKFELTDDGKWDASFQLNSNHPVGFDLKNSPFGMTKFDYPFEQNIKFQDVIDGIIFYTPFYEFSCTIGIPNVVDNEFAEELINRGTIMFGKEKDSKRRLKKYYNKVRSFECYDYSKFKEQMKKWLK